MNRSLCLVPLAIALVSLVVTLYASLSTSLSLDELAVLAAVNRTSELVRGVAEQGFSRLLLPDAASLLTGPSSGALLLFAGWAKLSLGRGFNPLTSIRLPWLLLSALAPVALYGITAHARGRVIGALAALTLLFAPRWLHGAVVLSDGALVASLWLIVLVAYVRTHQARARARWLWAVMGALCVGFGAALSLATLWVLPFVLVHFVVARFGVTRRMLRKGRVPVPLFVVLALALGPIGFFLFSPALWRASAPVIVRHALAPLGPSIVPTEFAARTINLPPLPASYSLVWVLETTPLVLLVLAFVGILSILHTALARRFASGRLRPARDRTALGALVVLGLLATLVGPALAPTPLTSFPPRVELALPFVAIAVALGLERLASWVRPVKLKGVPAVLILSLVAVTTLSGVSTASASFNRLAPRSFRVGDGSELGPLLHEIARHGGAKLPPRLPPALFSELASLGRMQPIGAGTLRLVSLPRQRIPNARVVRRDGVVLWALVAE